MPDLLESRHSLSSFFSELGVTLADDDLAAIAAMTRARTAGVKGLEKIGEIEMALTPFVSSNWTA